MMKYIKTIIINNYNNRIFMDHKNDSNNNSEINGMYYGHYIMISVMGLYIFVIILNRCLMFCASCNLLERQSVILDDEESLDSSNSYSDISIQNEEREIENTNNTNNINNTNNTNNTNNKNNKNNKNNNENLDDELPSYSELFNK